jgi:hypothetical protein
MVSATSGYLWDHATALQHLRQETYIDSTMMLRGHKGPRRYVRPVALPPRSSHGEE